MELRKQLIQDIKLIPECRLTEVSVAVRKIINEEKAVPMPPLVEYDREEAIEKAIADRKAGNVGYITGEESIKRLKQTIERVVGHKIEI
jgi:hypothetical protein